MKLLMQVTIVAALTMAPAGQIFASEWIPCAGENQYCSVPGTRMVRYGAGDRWSMRMATKRINCSNEVFGDPAPNTAKACYYEKVGSSYEPYDDDRRPPSGRHDRDRHYSDWVECAGEGGYCDFKGFREVRYGNGDRWNYKSAKGGIGCSNSVFGDPAPGAAKRCYYKNVGSSYGPYDDDRRPPSGRDNSYQARWVRCAGEGGYCNFNGFKEIRYGNGSRWNYKSARNGIGCSNNVFGDPAPGASKECFIKVD